MQRPSPIPGLHHVTAIVSDAQRTFDFYTQILGLRLVKQTVNFDDPGSYHLYFGDDSGSPGTILTFFAWPGATRGTLGVGETQAIAFSVPPHALDFWLDRLQQAGLAPTRDIRFGEPVLAFPGPDGIELEIVAGPSAGPSSPARTSDISSSHAIRGFHGVTLLEEDLALTEPVFTTLGFSRSHQADGRFRFVPAPAPGNTSPATRIDLLLAPQGRQRGRMGAGTIHHIAFRNADDADQLAWRELLSRQGLDVTPVMDRTYFHSVYFREPGGVLFELATDPPGFTLDEPIESLGQSLHLPPQFRSMRPSIEKHLPPLTLARSTPHQGNQALCDPNLGI